MKNTKNTRKENPRNKVVPFRTTKEEYEILSRSAKMAGKSVSSYLQDLVDEVKDLKAENTILKITVDQIETPEAVKIWKHHRGKKIPFFSNDGIIELELLKEIDKYKLFPLGYHSHCYLVNELKSKYPAVFKEILVTAANLGKSNIKDKKP